MRKVVVFSVMVVSSVLFTTMTFPVVRASSLKSNSAPLSIVQSNNAISGTVFNAARQPLPDLWIELLDEVNSMIGRTRTDSVGRFSFYRLTSGTFQVRVLTYGTNYISQTERVTLVPTAPTAGRGSHHEQIDFYLREKADPGNSGAGTPGTVFAQEVPDAARKAYERGVSLIDEGKNVEAGITKLKEATVLFPEYYLALERLGMEYVKLQQYDPAFTALNKAITVNPRGYNSFYTLGVAQYRLKRFPEAAEALSRMVGLAPGAPNTPFAQYFLGLALIKSGKPEEAESHLKRAYEQGGKNIPVDVHMALAQIFSNSKRYKEAADELELFLKEAPDATDTDKIKAIIKQLRDKAKSAGSQSGSPAVEHQAEQKDQGATDLNITEEAESLPPAEIEEEFIISTLAEADNMGNLVLTALDSIRPVELSPVELIAEVIQSGMQMNMQLASYTYSLRKVRRILNAKGKIRSENYKDYEAYPVQGQHALIQLAENGTSLPLTRIDLNRKSATDLLIRKTEEVKHLSEGSKGKTPKASYWGAGVQGRGQRKGQTNQPVFITISPEIFFQACNFSLPRMTRLEGRETIIMDFRPRSDIHLEKDRNWVGRLSGTIWIDASDKSLVRIEGRVDLPDYSRSEAGTEPPPINFVYQQQKLADGIWAPRLIRINAAGNENLYNGLNWDAWFQFSDFKRFDASNSEVKLTAPDDKKTQK